MARRRPTGCTSAVRPRWIAGAFQPARRAANGGALIPAAHVAFLQALSIDHRDGDYLFVHAGIRPGVALARQAEDDKLGIRQSFLASEQDFGVDRRARPLREPLADDQAEPHRHRHRRGQWRQTHLRGVRGRRRGIHVGVGRASGAPGPPYPQVERTAVRSVHARSEWHERIELVGERIHTDGLRCAQPILRNAMLWR